MWWPVLSRCYNRCRIGGTNSLVPIFHSHPFVKSTPEFIVVFPRARENAPVGTGARGTRWGQLSGTGQDPETEPRLLISALLRWSPA